MKTQRIAKAVAFLAAAALAAGVNTSAIASVSFSSASGDAQAVFGVDQNGNLVVTLENLSTATTSTAASQVLTSVFFNIDGNTALTPVSALLYGNSTVLTNGLGGAVAATGIQAGPNVGGEWEYLGGGGTLAYGASQGISSSGLGIFGAGNFNGPSLTGLASVDGIDYGIVGTNSLAYTDGIKNANLIQNGVQFVLTNFDGNLNGVTNVTFQYGTALSDSHFAAVPEAGTLLAGALLLLPFGASMLRILRRKRMT